MANPPLFSLKEKGISIAIFPTKFGKSISVQKQYMDKKDGTWKTTNFYFENDLEILHKFITQAKEFIAKNIQEEPLITPPTIAFDDDDIPF